MMKLSTLLILSLAFPVIACSPPERAATPTQSVAAPAPEEPKEFEQMNPAATPLRITYARRTEWYHPAGPGYAQYSPELRAAEPATDVVLVVGLAGITLEDFQAVQQAQPAEGVGTLYSETAAGKRVFNMAMTGTVDDKPKITLATTLPRSATEARIVVGDRAPAVVKLIAPVVPEITSVD